MTSHLEAINRRLAELDTQTKQILDILTDIKTQGKKAYTELEHLEKMVKTTNSVEASTVLLLKGLADDLSIIKSSPEKIQILSDNLKNSAERLATAIVENTH